MATPLANEATQAKIQDFLEATLKTKVIDNQTLDGQIKFGTATQWGK